MEDEARALGVEQVELRLKSRLAAPFQPDQGFAEYDLDLDAPESEVWGGRLTSNARQNIRKAERAGLRFSISREPGPAYALLSRTIRDLGTPFHGRRLFDLILERFPEEASFSEVRAGSRLICTGLLLRFGDALMAPFIGSLKEARSTGSNHLQYWGIIRHCLRSGVRRFELGRSPRGSSHARFKLKWGAREIPVFHNRLHLKGRPRPFLSRPPRTFLLAAEAWKRVPLAVARGLGHHISRRIP